MAAKFPSSNEVPQAAEMVQAAGMTRTSFTKTVGHSMCLVWILGHALCSVLILDLALSDSPIQLPVTIAENKQQIFVSLAIDSVSSKFQIELDSSESSIEDQPAISNIKIGEQTLEQVSFAVTSRNVLGASPKAFATQPDGNRFFPQLKNISIPNIIGLEIPPTSEFESKISFGGYDRERIEAHSLVYASVKSSDAWDIEAEKICVGEETLKVKDIRLSSSFSAIVFPNASEPAIEKIFPRLYRIEDESIDVGWFTPCTSRSSLPDLQLQIEKKILTLKSKYFVNKRSTEGHCHVPFRFHEHDRMDLGVLWMQRFYTVFDAERNQVGIAKLKSAVGSVKNGFSVPLPDWRIGILNRQTQDRFGLIPGQRFDGSTFLSVFRALYQQQDIPRVIGFSFLPSSALFVGGIDFAHMGYKVVYTDSVSDTDEMNFVFEIESFGFGNRNFGVGLEVQLGSTYSIVLPEASRAFVESVFPPIKEDEYSSAGWRTPCHSGKLPDLCLTIGGKPLCFPSLIFSEVDYSEDVCSIKFRFHDSFLVVVPIFHWSQQFYTQLDLADFRIGFAPWNLVPVDTSKFHKIPLFFSRDEFSVSLNTVPAVIRRWFPDSKGERIDIPRFVDTVIEHAAIPVWAFSLSADARLILGGYDSTCLEDDISFFHHDHVHCDGFGFGDKDFDRSVRMDVAMLIFFPYNTLSKEPLSMLSSVVVQRADQSSVDEWWTPCSSRSSLPSFGLTIAGQRWTLGSEYFTDRRSARGNCRLLLSFQPGYKLFPGRNWFRNFLVVFTPDTIGIGRLKPVFANPWKTFELELNVYDEGFSIMVPTGKRRKRNLELLLDSTSSQTTVWGSAPIDSVRIQSWGPYHLQQPLEIVATPAPEASDWFSGVIGASPLAFVQTFDSSLFRYLVREKQLPRILGLYLDDGEMTVGGYNIYRIKGELFYTKLLSETDWEIDCASFGFGKRDFGTGVDARLNTASPYIVLPESSRSYVSKLFPRAEQSSVDEWWTPCSNRSSLPSFGLTIAGQRWTLGSEYFTDRRSARGNCRLLLSFQPGYKLDLGHIWMRHFYIVLDAQEELVGIALPESSAPLWSSFKVLAEFADVSNCQTLVVHLRAKVVNKSHPIQRLVNQPSSSPSASSSLQLN